MIASITEVDITSLVLAAAVLIQVGVFGWVFRAGSARNELTTLSRTVGELAATVAQIGMAVVRGEANDANHAETTRELSARLARIERKLMQGNDAT